MTPTLLTVEAGAVDLRKWLRNRGKTQRDLAREAGVTEGFICDVVHGRRNVTPRIREALARLDAAGANEVTR